MSNWAKLEAAMLSAAFSSFGQTVIYTPLVGGPLQITAILSVGGALAISGTYATAEVKIADLPSYPVKNDIVSIPPGLTNFPAGDYLVQDVERGTIGEAKLTLRKKP